MPNYKKITGNFIDVIEATGLPSAFYTLQKSEEGLSPSERKKYYDYELEKDSHRTAYVSYSLSVNEMKSKVKDTSSLYNDITGELIDDTKPLVYAQGMLDGGMFVESFIKSNDAFFCTAGQDNSPGFLGSIRTIYVDDNDKNSGFALAYLRDDSDLSVPLEKRKRLLSIAIIKNTNAALEEREVTFYIDDSFNYSGRNSSAKLDILDDRQLFNDIALNLNSKNFEENIKEIFSGDTFSQEKFNQLSTRIRSNKNIDNRDLRKKSFNEQLDIAEQFMPKNDEFRELIAKFRDDSIEDINFFRIDNYQKSIKNVFELTAMYISNSQFDEQAKEKLLIINQLTYFPLSLEVLADEAPSDIERGQFDSRPTFFQAASIVRAARDNPDDQDLLASAFKIINRYSVQIDLVNKSSYNPRVNLLKEQLDLALNTFHSDPDFSDKIEWIMSLTQDEKFIDSVGFSNKIDDVFTLIQAQINQDENESDALNQSKYHELTYHAIKLELLAYDIPTLLNRVIFFEQAAFLRKVRDNPGNLNDIKRADLIIEEYQKQRLPELPALPEMPLPFEPTPVPRRPVLPPLSKQNFMRRNFLPALLLSLSVISLVSAVLVLTGVLAPLGIIVAGSAGLIGSAVTAVSTGIIALLATRKIYTKEIQLGKEKSDYLADIATRKNIIDNNTNAEALYNERVKNYDDKCEKRESAIAFSKTDQAIINNKVLISKRLETLQKQFDEEDKEQRKLASLDIGKSNSDILPNSIPEIDLANIPDSNDIIGEFHRALEQANDEVEESNNIHIKAGSAPAIASAKEKSSLSIDEILPAHVEMPKQS